MMDNTQEYYKNDMDSINCSELPKEGEENNGGKKYFERLRDALSVRAKNILLDNELYDYDDFLLFISSNNRQFVNLRNCGKKTVKELNELENLLLCYQKDPASILNTPITEVGFSVRTVISLKAAYIETLGELVSFNKDDILRYPGMGKKNIQEIEIIVNSKGLQLGMDIDAFCHGVTTNSVIHFVNKEVQRGENDIVSVLMIPIENLGLSVRPLNCLKAAEIEVLGELVVFNKADLIKFRNMGKKSLQEIENAVISKGLRFGFDLRTIDQRIDIKPQTIPNGDTTESSDAKKEDEQDEIVDTSLLDISIEDLGFSVRSFNCLETAGIETLGDLVAFEKEDLFKFHNLGRKSIQEIEEVVNSKGLWLGMDTRKYHKGKAIKQHVLDSLFSNIPVLKNLSKTDLDYSLAFKEKFSHFPMVFLLYKSLNYLTEREQKIVKMVWGLKSFSLLPNCQEIPDFKAWFDEPALPMSINEISNEFDLTRQRIHQIYQKANRRIKHGGSDVVHILKLEDWEKYGISKENPFLFTSDLNTDYLIEERDFLIEYIQKNWNTEWIGQFVEDVPYISENSLYYVSFLMGLTPFWIDQKKKELSENHLALRPVSPDFYVDNRLKQYNYNRAIKEVCRLQKAKKTESVLVPIKSYFIDNKNYWSRNNRLTAIETDATLQLLIWVFQTLCDVQIESDCILFKVNKVDYSDKIYEILKTAGVRLHRDEIFKQLQISCFEMGLSCKFKNSSQITPYLTKDSRIVSIGKSSFWGLKEWGEVVGSIREIAIELVKKSEEPIHIIDITKRVLESRPDSNENSVSSIIWQTTASKELVLFYGDYIGYPNRKYKDKYIIMPQTFDDWLKAFNDYVVKNKHFPYCNQDGFEGYLYRWHFKAGQFTDLSSEEILKFEMLEKDLAHYPHNSTEFNFLHNCNLYKLFVEGNNRMLKDTDDPELFKWFYSASRNYSTYKDNRNKYFTQLLQYLSSKLY